jgi:5-methylcytosine-specific restriction endonuclease McrA
MRTLVLNASYMPFDVWSWQRAMKKLFSPDPKVSVVSEYERVIRDGSGNEYNVPAVVLLHRMIDKENRLAPYSKMNIYARDQQVCQYCGVQFPLRKLTLDHVIPQAHWNPKRFHFKKTSFENVVACCKPCNTEKRNRTPQQAGMRLLRKPRRITQAEAYRFKLLLGTIPAEWNEYLLKDKEYERILQERQKQESSV